MRDALQEFESRRGWRPTVALFDWSQLVEDFLDNIGVSFEAFCREMSGGWMFGYIDALRLAGVRCVLFCVSARVAKPSRFRHRATGATICVLPAPKVYRALRRRILNPYAATLEAAAGDVRGAGRRIFWSAAKELAPYLSTPLLHFARELRRERCDAVLCQDYEHGRFDVCVAIGQVLRLRVFATFQGGSGDDASRNRLEGFIRRLSVGASAGLIVASGGEAGRVRARYGLPRERVARIFNPVDLKMWPPVAGREAARQELGIASGARVAVWHGRVDFRRKGLDVLLNAWQKVCVERAGRDVRLLLVGTGNDARELRAALAEMKPQGLTWVDEYVNDRARLRLYLQAADVYVFPSRHEGFPVAPVEGMACGLPLVAADAEGVDDILEGGEASGGVVVRRGDAEAFGAALGRLLDDETLSRTLGARARRRVEEKFSLEAVGAQLRAFLSEEHRQTRGVNIKCAFVD